MSLGGSTESRSEKDAIKYAVVTKGVLVIASAGNSGSGKVGCPCFHVGARFSVGGPPSGLATRATHRMIPPPRKLEWVPPADN